MYGLFNCIDLSLGGKSKGTQRKIAEFKNNIAFQNAFHHFALQALSRYKIDNLEPCMSDRVVHTAMLYHGAICVFEKDGAILALPAAPCGNPNLNGDYKSCWVYGRNGFNEEIPLYIPGADETNLMKKGYVTLNQNSKPRGVLIRENQFMYPFINFVIDYSEKVADAQRTIDTLRNHLKHPFVVACERELIPTVQKYFDQMSANQSVVVVDTGIFPVDKVNVIPMDISPETIKTTTDLIEWYYNDFYRKQFINSNANPDKKERMSTVEVNSNNESTLKGEDEFRDYLTGQLDFCNECLGTNLKLKEEPKDDDVQRMDGNIDTNSDKSMGS